MRLEREELALFEAACADPGNLHAQELLNMFGAEDADCILQNLPGVPIGLFAELVGHIWHAIDEARQRDRFKARFSVAVLPS